MRALFGLSMAFVIAMLVAACGDDGGGGGTDMGTADLGSDAGPMCIDPGQGCSFTECCEGYCCCVAVNDAASCAYTCIADRTGRTCR